MSPLPNGNNGYVNGDHGSNHANQYDHPYRDGGTIAERRDQRAGGYGGFDGNISNLAVPPDAEQGTSVPFDEQATGTYNGYAYPQQRAVDRSHGVGQGSGVTRERDGLSAPTLYGNGPGGRQIEESLDAQIAEKHFLVAVDLLQDALRTIRRSEMESISALSDLRVYFSNQETVRLHVMLSLTDILVEELHDHLYLKNPECQDRWKTYLSTTQGPGESTPTSLRESAIYTVQTQPLINT
ncbi:MAG: hypothetical protein Q9166_001231 [cf. Caloplaca sp. 2 TL-2023]